MALKSIFAVVSHGISALFSNLRNRSTATSSIVHFPHDSADQGPDLHVRFREGSLGASVTGMVKVFGCRRAYENRPSTNPRACVDSLWGFRLLPERDDGCVGLAMAPTGTRRVRFCAERSLDLELAACDVHAFSHGPCEMRADDGRRN